MFYTSLRVLWRTCFNMLTIYFLHTKSCKLPTFSDCEVLETYKLDANSTSRPALLKCKFSLYSVWAGKRTNDRTSALVSESNKARNVDRMNFHDYIQFSSLVLTFSSFCFCESNFGEMPLPRTTNAASYKNVRVLGERQQQEEKSERKKLTENFMYISTERNKNRKILCKNYVWNKRSGGKKFVIPWQKRVSGLLAFGATRVDWEKGSKVNFHKKLQFLLSLLYSTAMLF